jgi:hypothetical protein
MSPKVVRDRNNITFIIRQEVQTSSWLRQSELCLYFHRVSTMINQVDFVSTETELMEDVDPSIDQGGRLKTRNPKKDPRQRRFVHVADTRSKFKKTIEMVTCLHGWTSAEKTKAMTLIIIRFHLSCSARNHHYKTATIRFSFGEKKGSPRKANPTVVAYAPFVEFSRYNETEVARTIRKSLEVSLGVDKYVTGEGKASMEQEEAYTRKYFDKGTANPIIDEEDANRMLGVEWYLEQNEKQADGVSPDFRVAVLLERDVYKDGSQAQFIGQIELDTEAGMWEDFKQGTRRLFGRPEDEEIIFDPSLPGQAAGKVGKALLAAVKQYENNLVALDEGDELVGLCSVYGLHPIKEAE